MSRLSMSLMLFLILSCSFILSASAKSCRGGSKPKTFKCKPSDRKGLICPEIFQPVCGFRPGIRCFTTPCTHVTFSNSCFACHDTTVVSYTIGECTVID